MEKTVYIVRHGQTDLNKRNIIQGSGVDASLNDFGRKQAQAFFEHYKEINFDVVLTSRLIRTHQTMEPFIQTGLAWEQFEEINEMGWGVHEGKAGTPETIAQYQQMIQEWQKGNFDARIEGGESARQLADRISSFIAHLKAREEETILICSHGRAMRCMMTLLKGLPLPAMEDHHHANTGLYLVDYQPDVFSFQLENDIRHLEAYSLV